MEKEELLGKLKNAIGAGLFASLLGISGTYAASATQNETMDVAADSWASKLTSSYYATTNEKEAADLNLRTNYGPHALWLGYYWRGNEFEQARTGYEYTAQFPFIQLIPSLQLASHGFVGGSINTQIGESIYALLGLGRTNLQDYYNLNFDPNDSVLYGFGTSLLPKSNLSIFTVMDDRLHTDQIITHAVWRLSLDNHQRLAVDLSSKHGRATVNDELVSGDALSVTYDFNDVFFRLVKDRMVNFTNENQTRLSVGLRY